MTKFRVGEYICHTFGPDYSRRYCVQKFIPARRLWFITIPERWHTVMNDCTLAVAQAFIANNGKHVRVVEDDESG